MKFKLNKSQHYNFFNVLKNIDKLNLSLRENKTSNNDNLIFLTHNNSLHIYCGNGLIFAYFDLNVELEDDSSFAVDFSLFNNAFNNFPSDEVNFAFIEDKNSLVFGNKKTKVALNTSVVNNSSTIIEFIDSNYESNKISNLYESIKNTSFSCSNMIEEYPYSSMMIYFDGKKFNTQSSDKHRITMYGNDFDSKNSFLISKQSGEILNVFLKEFEDSEFTIENNCLIVKNQYGKISSTLEKNIHSNIFDKFTSFYEESEKRFEFVLNKYSFLKSLKFISSVSGNETIEFNFQDDVLLLSGNTNEKGMVADKFNLNISVPSLSVSFVQNHIVKAFDIIETENIKCEILNYNSYNILKISNNHFNHLIFPMM